MKYEVIVENYGFMGLCKDGTRQSKVLNLASDSALDTNVATLRERKRSLFEKPESTRLDIKRVGPNVLELTQVMPFSSCGIAEISSRTVTIIDKRGSTKFLGITGDSRVEIVELE